MPNKQPNGLGHESTAFIAALERSIEARQARRERHELIFLCPSHRDIQPSARWNTEKHVWHCFACGAGGGAYDLAKRLGVELPATPATGLTIEELAAYVALPVDFLRSIGLSGGIAGIERSKCVDMAYIDEAGALAIVRKRVRLSGEPKVISRKGDRLIPYGLSRLRDARKVGWLLIVEGESDSWTGWFAGVPVLGIPGASTWKGEWKRYVQDIPSVYLWREPDGGGDTFAAKVSADLPAVRIVTAPSGLKDLSALWHAAEHDQAAFLSRLGELLAESRPASQVRAQALTAEARELFDRCGSILHDPKLLDIVGNAFELRGYVGDLTAPKMAYLALSSRLLERPLNLAFVAPSSAGKNRAVDAALELMPEDAFHLEKAGSARALIYSDESFEHRAVIVAEADSIPQDEGSAASAIRSLAEDGYMTYDVVQQSPDTGDFVTRRIAKPGPTALITTSTRPLKEQMTTRMLTVTINDSPDQTREVLKSHAASVNGNRPNFDTSALIAMQRWVTIAGDHEVTIPFAHALAEKVPVSHVRMRRDFRQLLTVIQTVAMLYQCQRGRDEAGRIIATLEDYDIARTVVMGAFTTAASGGVTTTVRHVVDALTRLHAKTNAPCTRKALAIEMGLATDTTWHRVERAIELGYIVNLETRPHQPAKLVPGEPLPDAIPPLPTVEQLAVVPLPENHSIVHSPVDCDRELNLDATEPQQGVNDQTHSAEEHVSEPFQSPNDLDLNSSGGSYEAPNERLKRSPDEHNMRSATICGISGCDRPSIGGQLCFRHRPLLASGRDLVAEVDLRE